MSSQERSESTTPAGGPWTSGALSSPVPDLKGRVAIVTGAGSRGPGIGNGRAAAILLARAGAAVAVVDREAESAEQTLALVEAAGGRGAVFLTDVSEPSGATALVEQAVERFGRLDILVNNVGILGTTAPVEEIEVEDWDLVMRVNVRSMLLTTQRAVAPMLATGGGSVVNISSIAGMVGTSGPPPYAASKAAVIGLTRSLAGHLGRRGIRVNAVAPGAVYTPMVADMTAEKREFRRQLTPLGVEGTGWDVGQAVVFLASDAARWVNGVVLPVDAGFTAVIPT